MTLALGSTGIELSSTSIFQDTISEGLPFLAVSVTSSGQLRLGALVSDKLKYQGKYEFKRFHMNKKF